MLAKAIYDLKTVVTNGVQKEYWTRIGIAIPRPDGSYELKIEFDPKERTEPNVTRKMILTSKREKNHEDLKT